eukprot:14696135-Ditylum_brightwellii.AAC.1
MGRPSSFNPVVTSPLVYVSIAYLSRYRAESGRNGRIDEFVMEPNGRPISCIWSRSQAASSCSITMLASSTY